MQQQQFAIASLTLVIFLTSSSLVSGQVFRGGLCPSNVQTVQDFDPSAYLGTWYEYAKYPFLFEAGGRCISANYDANGDDEVTVTNTQVNFKNQNQSIDGFAKIVGPGKLSVRFNGFASLAGDADYWVIGTDYNIYAVVYSCKSLLFAHAEVIWILTRERNPSEETIKTAMNVITGQNLSLKELTITSQFDCQNQNFTVYTICCVQFKIHKNKKIKTYNKIKENIQLVNIFLVEHIFITANLHIIMYLQLRMSIYAALLLLICQLTTAQVPFPRSCPDVKVPDDFHADAYMGTWFEYAKYPHIFEIAKRCMFARYSNKGNNTISVVNTSINTLSGHTTNSTAIAHLLAPSQINVLFGKFPNSPDVPNYIVLGTDYKTYSVVYSCNNMTSLAHTKLLWIMTRERKPSAETVAAAKKVMDDNNLPQSFLLIADQDNCPEVTPSYGMNVQFGSKSNNNNNIHRIDKNADDVDEDNDALGDSLFISKLTTTTNSPTPAMPDMFEITTQTAANVMEMA
ncbi:uncharacterized protein [Eurosta solidaginis]|uniref:uncharacterized protein n=1 Tax=Eurosta solidaginis TaxID=178769 RepID=UPI00353161AB